MLGKQKPKVVVYSTSTCPVCKRAKEYLSQKLMPTLTLICTLTRRAHTYESKNLTHLGEHETHVQ